MAPLMYALIDARIKKAEADQIINGVRIEIMGSFELIEEQISFCEDFKNNFIYLPP